MKVSLTDHSGFIFYFGGLWSVFTSQHMVYQVGSGAPPSPSVVHKLLSAVLASQYPQVGVHHINSGKLKFKDEITDFTGEVFVCLLLQ